MKRPRSYFSHLLTALVFTLLIAGVLAPDRMHAEDTVDLSGTWRFRFDPSDVGESDGWQRPGKETWNTMQVPMSYNAGDQSWYAGAGWYRTSFQVPANWSGGHLFLKFLGVNIRSKIWVNGQLVGEHNYPYLPFEVDITDAVKPGATNWLVVRADNRILARAVPDKNWDGWWNYGGIIRAVKLVRRPDVYTRDAIIETTLGQDGAWHLNLLLNTFNLRSSNKGSFDLTINDAQGNPVYNGVGQKQIPAGHTQYNFTIRLDNVRAWTPASPNLYTLHVITAEEGQNQEHEIAIRFGFRQIEVRGTQIVLNGKPILIKGISRHEMYPGVGMTVSEQQLRSDLRDIKELGCNMIRTTHYAQDPRFYDLADEMGFLVWTEIPAWKTSVDVLSDESVWQHYLAPQLEALVQNFRTHPSVIIWSVGNEFRSNTEAGKNYVRRAARYVKALDRTRLVSFASDKHRPGADDESFQFVDVLSINEYYGWYYGTMQDVGPTLDRLHQKWPDKPILISEVGSGTVPGIHNPNPGDSGKDYSVEYQQKFLRTHLNQIYAENRRSFVAGALLWIYNDFPDPHRVGGGHPVQNNYVNSKGLVTRDRQRKPAFDTVKEIFHTLP